MSGDLGHTIRLPRHVQKMCSSNIDTLIPDSLEIIQTSSTHETGRISSCTHLRFSPIIFVQCFEEVIIVRLAVHPLIQQEGVTWQRLQVSATIADNFILVLTRQFVGDFV